MEQNPEKKSTYQKPQLFIQGIRNFAYNEFPDFVLKKQKL